MSDHDETPVDEDEASPVSPHEDLEPAPGEPNLAPTAKTILALGVRLRISATRSVSRGRKVKAHVDVPLHVYNILRALGLQYRRVLTRVPLGNQLVTAEPLQLDNDKETVWMAAHAESDLGRRRPARPARGHHVSPPFYFMGRVR